MIELQKTFVSGAGGFSGPDVLTYTQVAISDRAAVYERSRGGLIKDYEVFLLKIIPKGTSIFNQPPSLDDECRYPSTGDFGKTAFSIGGVNARERALEKFKQLNEESEEKLNPTPKEEIKIPGEPFTTKDLLELNSINYPTASNWIKENLDKKIKFLYEKNTNVGGRGKKSKFYGKI